MVSVGSNTSAKVVTHVGGVVDVVKVHSVSPVWVGWSGTGSRNVSCHRSVRNAVKGDESTWSMCASLMDGYMSCCMHAMVSRWCGGVGV